VLLVVVVRVTDPGEIDGGAGAVRHIRVALDREHQVIPGGCIAEEEEDVHATSIAKGELVAALRAGDVDRDDQRDNVVESAESEHFVVSFLRGVSAEGAKP
jgi:hypothetical protein